MPPFGRNEWREEDFQLLRNSAIHLFWQRAVLDETVSKLREAGYTVIALDAGRVVVADRPARGHCARHASMPSSEPIRPQRTR